MDGTGWYKWKIDLCLYLDSIQGVQAVALSQGSKHDTKINILLNKNRLEISTFDSHLTYYL